MPKRTRSKKLVEDTWPDSQPHTEPLVMDDFSVDLSLSEDGDDILANIQAENKKGRAKKEKEATQIELLQQIADGIRENNALLREFILNKRGSSPVPQKTSHEDEIMKPSVKDSFTPMLEESQQAGPSSASCQLSTTGAKPHKVALRLAGELFSKEELATSLLAPVTGGKSQRLTLSPGRTTKLRSILNKQFGTEKIDKSWKKIKSSVDQKCRDSAAKKPKISKEPPAASHE